MYGSSSCVVKYSCYVDRLKWFVKIMSFIDFDFMT